MKYLLTSIKMNTFYKKFTSLATQFEWKTYSRKRKIFISPTKTIIFTVMNKNRLVLPKYLIQIFRISHFTTTIYNPNPIIKLVISNLYSLHFSLFFFVCKNPVQPRTNTREKKCIQNLKPPKSKLVQIPKPEAKTTHNETATAN